jgi:hypothetical protein
MELRQETRRRSVFFGFALQIRKKSAVMSWPAEKIPRFFDGGKSGCPDFFATFVPYKTY